jgi:hypothetical protein
MIYVRRRKKNEMEKKENKLYNGNCGNTEGF